MSLEVEMKYSLADAAAVTALRMKLAALGAEPAEPLHQRDVYLAHPSRDFAQTDEAFRIRCVGEENYLTYKGPLLDEVTKTRHEIEIATAAGAGACEQLLDMFTRLGFRAVRDVVKRREPFFLLWQDRDVEIVLDDVRDLGWFAELEIIAEVSECDAARECLFALSRELNLGKSERRSYLRLLLEQDVSA
ncbi:MAG: class IV adenylate cyclase [Planctomycetes bacterium]|nr:class IV adenylate cyclase [Planctomycetota bacterium]